MMRVLLVVLVLAYGIPAVLELSVAFLERAAPAGVPGSFRVKPPPGARFFPSLSGQG